MRASSSPVPTSKVRRALLAEEGGACAVINKPLVAAEVIEALERRLPGGPILGTH